MFTGGLMITILNQYRSLNESISKSVKYALLNEAKSECGKPLSERKEELGNPYMNPMGVTFVEFIQYVIQQYKDGVSADSHWKEIAKVRTFKFISSRNMDNI